MDTCPVCGFRELTEPPRSLRTGGGSFEICPSCGLQFGVSDDDLGYTYKSWRAEWIERGMSWSSAGQPPPGSWDPVAQMKELDLPT